MNCDKHVLVYLIKAHHSAFQIGFKMKTKNDADKKKGAKGTKGSESGVMEI